METRGESIGILFARVVEPETEISVDPQSDVVVHDVDLRVVLGRGSGGRGDGRLSWQLVRRFARLTGREDDGPSIESNLLRFDDVFEQIQGILSSRIPGAPAQDASQVIAGSEGNDGTWRGRALRVLAHVIQTLEDPSDRSISSAHQDLVVFDMAEHVQPVIRGRQSSGRTSDKLSYIRE